MFKRLCSLALFLLLLFLCGCGEEIPAETTAAPTFPAGAVQIGNSTYFCITTQSEQSTQPSEDGQTVTATAFVHQIFDPDGEPLVTLTTVAAGVLSNDGTCQMSKISGTLSEEQSQGITYSTHLSSDTGTIILYRSNISACHFQYRIHEDGTIEFL